MKIISNNFYYVEDRLLSIVTLQVGGTSVPVGTAINFFVDTEMSGEKLVVTTVSNVFEYDIVDDGNEIQQIYNLIIHPTGLISNINTFEGVNSPESSYDIEFNTATVFKDYDFWFSRNELKITIPDNETVDRLEEIYSENLKQFNLDLTALQNTVELVIFTENTPQLNLDTDAFMQFRIFTNTNSYLTNTIKIVPGDPSLSECIVSGTLFEGNSVLSEENLKNQNMSIELSLRFETWIDDISIIRSELNNIINSEIISSIQPVHFQDDVPPPANTVGLDKLITDANVSKFSEQIVVISLGRNIDISHPETVSIQGIPSHLIRSGISSIPIVAPPTRVILPFPGELQVITTNGDTINEKDFWTGDTRITLRANNDIWQDVSSLTTSAYNSFHNHVRSSMTSESEAWTNFIQHVDFSLSSSGPDLFIDIPQQTSNSFNIDTTIEVSIDIGMTTSDGIPTRLSNNTFVKTDAFLIVKPVQSFILCNRNFISEADLWYSDVRAEFKLVDDIFITGSDVVLNHLVTQFNQKFPTNEISSSLYIQDFNNDSFTLVIPRSTPSSFNINSDTYISFNFEPTFFRNGTKLYAPEILFGTMQSDAIITGTSSITSQNVIQGFSFSIEVTNNSFNRADINPVVLTSRSDESTGWNSTVVFEFHFETDSRLTVAIQPAPTYKISAVEIIDIYLLKNSTYNRKLQHAGYFTVQGSTLIERRHHEYLRSLNLLMFELNAMKRILHSVKLSVTDQSDQIDLNGNFTTKDSLYQRLMKLNSSDIEHPVAICKPPLINNKESVFIQTSIGDVLNTIRNYTLQRPFLTPVVVPHIVPEFDSSRDDTLYSVVLTRPLSISVNTDGHIHHYPPGKIHVIPFLRLNDSMVISGEGVYTLSLTRQINQV